MKTRVFVCLVTTIVGLGGLTSAAEPPGNVSTPAAASVPTSAPSAPAPAPVAAPSEPKGAEAGKPSSAQPKPVSGPTWSVLKYSISNFQPPAHRPGAVVAEHPPKHSKQKPERTKGPQPQAGNSPHQPAQVVPGSTQHRVQHIPFRSLQPVPP